MARNIDTSLLRAFVAVAETSGMTTAANLLNLTQAAVSQQIKRLEDAFEAPLFERERKGLRLTSAGERLFVKAKRMLALNDDIWAEMTTPITTSRRLVPRTNDKILSGEVRGTCRYRRETHPDVPRIRRRAARSILVG